MSVSPWTNGVNAMASPTQNAALRPDDGAASVLPGLNSEPVAPRYVPPPDPASLLHAVGAPIGGRGSEDGNVPPEQCSSLSRAGPSNACRRGRCLHSWLKKGNASDRADAMQTAMSFRDGRTLPSGNAEQAALSQLGGGAGGSEEASMDLHLTD